MATPTEVVAVSVKTIEVIVSPELESVPRVRRLTRQVGEVMDRSVDPEVMALLTTELLSNAVGHGAGDIEAVFTSCPAGGVRVGVHDQAPGRPVLYEPDPLAEGGHRGLMIVDRLAESWGVDEDDDGKTVWFELAAS